MSEKKPPQDTPKLSDFELELLIIERDVAHYRVERLDELLNKVGAAQGYADASKPAAPTAIQAGVIDVKALLPQELADLLTFTEKDEYTVITPRRFLGSENFAKIAKILKDNGGEYISAGKDSHFRILKKKGP